MKKTPVRNGGDVLLELFQMKGFDHIFCSPLSVWAPLWEALARHRESTGTEAPRYINCRHEVLAVGLASGYYKATGRPQIVLLPTGMGVLNGAMAIRGAYQERVPMIILAPDSFGLGENPHLDPGPEWPYLLSDLGGPVRFTEKIVKWGKEIKNPRDLISDFMRACYFADMVPRGPTLLSIPFELLMTPMDFALPPDISPQPLVTAEASVRSLAETLLQSKNPIVIAEHACRSREDIDTLTRFSELLGAPVFEYPYPMYKNFPRTHPLHGSYAGEDILHNADCILLIGCNAPWHPPLVSLPETTKVIILEEDPLRPRAPYWGYKTDVCIAGDIRANLENLCRYIEEAIGESPGKAEEIAARDKHWREFNARNRQPTILSETVPGMVSATSLFRMLAEILPDNSVIVDEIIAQGMLMMQHLFTKDSFSHYRGAAGGLGTAIPTALGIKLADPAKPVVCIIGDGSFSYEPVLSCLGCSQQYKLPILIVICNNQGFASQTWNTRKYFPEGAAIRTGKFYGDVIEPTPDYGKIAAAFDAYGERVPESENLRPALERGMAAVNAGRLAIIDVTVQP